jgi:tRNA-Thr(GGU) m(6)t(6)A37 methyltransferase TsaA
MNEIIYHPIGVIHSNFQAKENMPIQASFAKDAAGYIEIFDDYVEGLKDLEQFSHLILTYHFHLSKGYDLVAKPFLDENKHGVFAIRSPRRPNPIGVSIVRLEGIEGNILHISEVDIIDGTPLLDIKPYIPDFDSRSDVKTGWYENRAKDNKGYKSDNRFG